MNIHIAKRIGKRQHLRGLLIGLGAAILLVLFMGLTGGGDKAMLGVVCAPLMLWLGHHLGSAVPDKLALQQAVVVARDDAPNFTVGRQLMGVNNASGILLDSKHSQFMVFDDHGARVSVLPYRGLMQCEIVEDGQAISVMSTNRGSQLLGAAVGGLVFGGLGAVVGALSGSKTSKGGANLSEIALRLTVGDEDVPTVRVVLFSVDKPVSRNSAVAKKALRAAEDASALIAVIMRKAAEQGLANSGGIGRPGDQGPQLASTQPMELM